MAKRKLLNQEREVILHKCLVKVFSDKLLALNEEAELLATKLFDHNKRFLEAFLEVDYALLEKLRSRQVLRTSMCNISTSFQYVSDSYIDSYNHLSKVLTVQQDINEVLKDILKYDSVSFKNYLRIEFSRHPDYYLNQDVKTAFNLNNQYFAIRFKTSIMYTQAVTHATTEDINQKLLIIKVSQNPIVQAFKEETEDLIADIEYLASKTNVIVTAMFKFYHELKAQLKGIANTQMLEDLLPEAYEFLPPVIDTEPKRISTSKALLSMGTIAHLNTLLTKGY